MHYTCLAAQTIAYMHDLHGTAEENSPDEGQLFGSNR